MLCFFATDLHGHTDRYEKLFQRVTKEQPDALLLGGDLLPHGAGALASSGWAGDDFTRDFLIARFEELRIVMDGAYPKVFVILGNDDTREPEAALMEAGSNGLWEYLHCRKSSLGEHPLYGYSYVPPTPFLLKDWERYDVSRYVDPGCVSPEEGRRTRPVDPSVAKYATIAHDLKDLTGEELLEQAVILFHTPPYQTNLDRAALDGKSVDYAPLDVHIGSVAVRRFIEERKPLLTLHGHVHEAARITGSWRDRIGPTVCLSAAHDGPELAIVRFDPDAPAQATRELV